METGESRDVYLTPDERFEIWTVKAAERPELLLLPQRENEKITDEGTSAQQEDNNNNHSVLPLQDGCDIPGWRHYGMV